ncbi:MAG TPA: polysaccharide deacetylase family protein [Candidatus Binataceae bacterium]|nr:polysaccharide deacetylase family protein [Candidatus Binataceae bacterium]
MLKPLLRLSARVALVFLIAALFSLASRPSARSEPTPAATILVYHRFGPTVADGMTITTTLFLWQLQYLRDHGYSIVPLRDVVNFAAGHGTLPPRAVAITADDGHISVFTQMKPIVERYRIPVTLFIYPSAISNASYAMTWEQLRALKATGLFDIQSHTYWHPNFNRERRRLPQDQFAEFVKTQLVKPIAVLKTRLGVNADMLAWPFGIYDDYLIRAARDAGYAAGFSIERHPVTMSSNVMALPRYLVTQEFKGKAFESVLEAGAARHASK